MAYRGISSAIEQGIGSYYQGKRYEEDKMDRGINRERSQKADQRAENEYQYGVSQRPVQEQMQQNKLKSQGIGLKKQEFDLESAKRQAGEEGLITALRYLYAGEKDHAMRVYNSAGQGRVKNIEQHPDDPNGEIWIAEGEDGKSYTINPRETLEKLGELKPATQNKLRGSDLTPVLDDQGIERYSDPQSAIGKRVPPSAKAGKSGSTPAILQETDAIFSRMKKQNPDADDSQLWLQAHERASQKSSTDPRDAAQKFYSGILAKLLPDNPFPEDVEKAKATANTLTEEFIQKYYGESSQPDPGGGGIKNPGSSQKLQPGVVMDGYRFLGGDPNNPNSWEPQ